MPNRPLRATLIRRFRHLGASEGLGYELFDDAVFVVVLTLLWYVVTDPSATTVDALSDTLSQVFAPDVWGAGLCIIAAVAVVLSHCSFRWVRLGYILLGCGCAGWSASLIAGVALSHPAWDMAGKSLGVAWLFAWVCRNMVHEISKASGRPPELPAAEAHAPGGAGEG